MQFWIIQGLNSLSLGGLLFLAVVGLLAHLRSDAAGQPDAWRVFHARHLSWRKPPCGPIPTSDLDHGGLGPASAFAAIGGLFERLVLTRLKTNPLGQVLVTLGMAFIISDACLVLWGGDSIPVPTPQNLQAPTRLFGFVFPTYRLVLVGCAIAAAITLYLLLERTRLGAMIRAGVDDAQMARAVGIPVSNLFTIVFCLGAGIAGAGGVLGGPILSAYPGLDGDMLPLALIVVILGGIGSLLGAFIGSFIVGFIYTFGTALFLGAGLYHPVPADDPRACAEAPRPAGASGRMKWIRSRLVRSNARLPANRRRRLLQSNLASQILIASVFALSLNLLVGFGGMTSLGHASFLGVAAYISALLTSRYGFGHGPAAIVSIAGTDRDGGRFRRHRATRIRSRLSHDHAGLVSGAVGTCLSDVERDERRQRDRRPEPADAAWYFARQCRVVLLVRAGGDSRSLPDDDDVRVVLVRLVVEGRPRPAAANGSTRLQSVDDPLDYVHLCRLLGRRCRIAVCLLQQIYPSDVAIHHEFGPRPCSASSLAARER